MIFLCLFACTIENHFQYQDKHNDGADNYDPSNLSSDIDALFEDSEETYTDENEIGTNHCSQTETIVWEVEFPATMGCEWNQNDNLHEREAFFQARKEQFVSYELDYEEEICDVRFAFSTEFGGIEFPFHYDDHVLFTFNDRIVFNSYAPLNENFATDEHGYFFYDWNDMKGVPMQFYVAPYGVGDHIQMNLPDHDQLGDASLSVDGTALSHLTREALKEKRLDLQFVSFGDNDSHDCEHSGFSFWVEVDLGVQ